MDGGRTTAGVSPEKVEKRIKAGKRPQRFVVRIGSVTVKAYPTPPGWTVSWVSVDGRQRKYVPSENKARELAADMAKQLSEGITKVISTEEIATLQRARELLRPFGVSIEMAVAEWVDVKKDLPDVTMGELKSFYLLRRAKRPEALNEAVDEFLKEKKQDRTGERHLADLTARLGVFKTDWPVRTDALRADQLDGWLRAKQAKEKWEPQTRNHYRAAVLNFLNWAERQRMLAFSPSEFAAFAPAAVERGEVGIFTPGDVEAMLRACPKGLRAAMVFGFFSGLRPSEVQRLRWEDVDLKEGHVFVRGKVRTARYRIAPLPANAVEWLIGLDRREKVCGYWHPGRSGADLAERVGVEWIHDGPRHSFVSYRLAVIGDLGKVSEETGTSAATLRLHYRRPIPRNIADKYFSIAPASETRQSIESVVFEKVA